MQHQCV